MVLAVVDVGNMALGRLGARSIATLGDNSVEARAVNRLFNVVRDLLLGVQDWRFATARVALGGTGQVPLFPFTYQYFKPADCIKSRYLVPTEIGQLNLANDDRVPYEEGVDVFGGTQTPIINTTISPAALVYTRQLTDPSTWDSDFVSLMSIQLAAEIALAVTGNGQVANAMRQAASQAIEGLQPSGMNEGVSAQQRGSRATDVR